MKILQANTLIGIFIGSLTFVTSVGATEIIHYQNKPVTIELHAGEERSIQFGDHVQVGITKGQQTMKLFRVQSAQGAVHFLPYREFEKQRVQIKRVSDGRIILVDLMATAPIGENTAPLEDVRLLLEEENEVPEDIKKEEKAKKQKAAVISPVDLTRYAAQRLYGPTRLHNDKPGILVLRTLFSSYKERAFALAKNQQCSRSEHSEGAVFLRPERVGFILPLPSGSP